MRFVSSALRPGLLRVLLTGLVGMATAFAQQRPREVLFVCEHGNVKSLIAATLFNQEARKRGMSIHSTARGIHPEAEVPVNIANALKNDGGDVSQFRPQALAQSDLSGARRVIAIGVDLAQFKIGESQLIDRWTDIPAASIDYAASRAALLRHIDTLLTELQSDGAE